MTCTSLHCSDNQSPTLSTVVDLPKRKKKKKWKITILRETLRLLSTPVRGFWVDTLRGGHRRVPKILQFLGIKSPSSSLVQLIRSSYMS